MTAPTIISRFHPVTSRLHRRGWILFTILGALVSAQAAFATDGPPIPNYSTKTDYQIAQDVAPHIYFHPEEHNWPVTIDWFIQNSNLKMWNTVTNTASTDLGPAQNIGNILSKVSSNADVAGVTYYLEVPERYEFLMRTLRGDPTMSHLTPYVRVRNNPYGLNIASIQSISTGGFKPLVLPPYKEVQFWFLYAFNGCQTHRIQALGSNFEWYTSRFQMCDAARHEGDLESVAVRINNSTGRPMGIVQSRHGDNYYTSWERLASNGTHPDIYPAWASHATYFSNGYHAVGLDHLGLDQLGGPPIVSIPTDMSGPAFFVCGILNLDYRQLVDLRATGGKQWDPALYKQNLVLLDNSGSDRPSLQTSPYTQYLGKWGAYEMHDRYVDDPAPSGFDLNLLGNNVITAVDDHKVASCFNTLAGAASADLFVDHGADWFGTKNWRDGMKPDKVD